MPDYEVGPAASISCNWECRIHECFRNLTTGGHRN